ncbi:hypothetical protein GQ54DRAFT_65449 [Martensiomyces pterosporus]|nr:hypothetical protein GQ54DRAFT_65449 [Martensiomyces pterosporus]
MFGEKHAVAHGQEESTAACCCLCLAHRPLSPLLFFFCAAAPFSPLLFSTTQTRLSLSLAALFSSLLSPRVELVLPLFSCLCCAWLIRSTLGNSEQSTERRCTHSWWACGERQRHLRIAAALPLVYHAHSVVRLEAAKQARRVGLSCVDLQDIVLILAVAADAVLSAQH